MQRPGAIGDTSAARMPEIFGSGRSLRIGAGSIMKRLAGGGGLEGTDR